MHREDTTDGRSTYRPLAPPPEKASHAWGGPPRREEGFRENHSRSSKQSPNAVAEPLSPGKSYFGSYKERGRKRKSTWAKYKPPSRTRSRTCAAAKHRRGQICAYTAKRGPILTSRQRRSRRRGPVAHRAVGEGSTPPARFNAIESRGCKHTGEGAHVPRPQGQVQQSRLCTRGRREGERMESRVIRAVGTASRCLSQRPESSSKQKRGESEGVHWGGKRGGGQRWRSVSRSGRRECGSPGDLELRGRGGERGQSEYAVEVEVRGRARQPGSRGTWSGWVTWFWSVTWSARGVACDSSGWERNQAVGRASTSERA
ncbi:hypothetical protein Mp_8g00520 [Marchantia polymorpha subsp. ruderalis]|uniref:Uncharacterized protein n=1 Tax=Marchantia polymorpha TaxID=3197 RepID=A0A2R6VXQ7_MARPO|nr:hypothetical protein MARPO_2256s0001 [Marchantia polymorpha]BBN18194.1 hypothetical protein Mp_8g00520 [Marchantia polymorpha subsp. ruderalis]|eukprot:PTQ26377.1 hypothetical protein MARPO_2256s0001 [Marchantia polymorpha]